MVGWEHFGGAAVGRGNSGGTVVVELGLCGTDNAGGGLSGERSEVYE